MPPPADPREMSVYPDPLSFSLIDQLGRRTNGNGYPHPDINDTRSLISRLTSELLPAETQLPSVAHSASDPNNALVYPDPTPDPNIKPKVKHLRPQFLQKVEHIPTVGGEVDLEEFEDKAEDEDRENQTPKKGNGPPRLSLRSPTLVQTPMMQLVNRISALCVDWNAISPDIAHSTCAVDASKLNLDIHLATALTNEGLAALRTKGLIWVQTLCQMIAVMTMSPMTISEESVETLVQEYNRDVQLLFVGVDPQKARLLSVEERMAMGWQLSAIIPATPRMGMVDEMPDMSYDYDTELYSDGES
uniref:Putative reverse transcriptase-rnase h-integrase n=1 Tax=Moniliophthora roreri TaxID=221103 RepID=A0A0W0GEP2_MONRR